MAVTATITAVAVPIVIDMKNTAKLSAAREDYQKISGAITAFVGDTGQFPAYGATAGTKNYFYILRSGSDTSKDPIFSPVNWSSVSPRKPFSG
jgi:hypothetical protein